MAYVRLVSAPLVQEAVCQVAPAQEVPQQEVIETSSDLTLHVESVAIPAEEAMAIIGTRAVPSTGATHLMATGQWTWDQMRDYVVSQVEAKWGPRPRDPLKESGIFKGFIKRWGAKSEPIARAAFEVYGGMWNGAPISIERFAQGSDAYFASVIAKSF